MKEKKKEVNLEHKHSREEKKIETKQKENHLLDRKADAAEISEKQRQNNQKKDRSNHSLEQETKHLQNRDSGKSQSVKSGLKGTTAKATKSKAKTDKAHYERDWWQRALQSLQFYVHSLETIFQGLRGSDITTAL